MFNILSWLAFGLIIGILVKILRSGHEEDFVGCLPTIFLGIIGSFCGGGLVWLFTGGNEPFSHGGILASIVGGVLFSFLWDFLMKGKD